MNNKYRFTKAEIDEDEGTLTLSYEHKDGIPRHTVQMSFDSWILLLESGYKFSRIQQMGADVIKLLKQEEK